MWIDKYQEFLNQEFELQEKEILNKNKKALFSNWAFDVVVSKQRILGTFIPLGITLMREAAKFAFDVADDNDTEFEINERITNYITERVTRFADEMNEVTISKLDESIAEGIAQGENLTKLRNRVQEIFTQATRERSERIARTEAIAASNEGANEAYRQSPLVNAKEWSANFGACEFCDQFNGKIVGLDEDFASLGETVTGEKSNLILSYEDIEHPPLHPNCRCALLPVIID